MPSPRRPTQPPTQGYSGTPLARKLGIGAGCRLYLRAAPANYAALVAPLPAGVRRVARIGADTDLIHLFATQRAELARALRESLAAMRADAVIWVSWPKKSSGRASELTEDAIRELALPLALVDVKVCAVDETWSGLKLVVRRAARAPGLARRAAAQRAPRP
jgi:Protein of unknown function (DUF3052)